MSSPVPSMPRVSPAPVRSSRLAKALKDASRGDLLELLATDPGSRSDVPSWATISGNELLESGQLDDGAFRYVIRKA